MIAAAHRRNGLVLLAGLALLAGCSFEMPSFLGREGGGDSFYQLRGEPPPAPAACRSGRRRSSAACTG